LSSRPERSGVERSAVLRVLTHTLKPSKAISALATDCRDFGSYDWVTQKVANDRNASDRG
jgi:hypothetical protein